MNRVGRNIFVCYNKGENIIKVVVHMEKTSIKTNTTTKDKAGFTSAELEEKFLKIAKHTTKDSVFRDLFGNTKYLLELYQILHPEDADVKE